MKISVVGISVCIAWLAAVYWLSDGAYLPRSSTKPKSDKPLQTVIAMYNIVWAIGENERLPRIGLKVEYGAQVYAIVSHLTSAAVNMDACRQSNLKLGYLKLMDETIEDLVAGMLAILKLTSLLE